MKTRAKRITTIARLAILLSCMAVAHCVHDDTKSGWPLNPLGGFLFFQDLIPDATNPTDTTNPTVTVSNVRNNGIVESGFMIGTATDNDSVTLVEVQIDGGGYNPATGTTNWKFQWPVEASTWKENSQHLVDVRARNAANNHSTVITMTVRKGTNKDVNGDGYADAIVGAYGDYNFVQGRAYIFHSAGNSGIVSRDLSSGGSADAILIGEKSDKYFGISTGLGDVNGDGYADAIVGAHWYNSKQGRVYIFHSAGSSGIATTAAGSADAILTGETSSYFGSSITLGDVNGDGYADAIIGAYGYNSKQGRAYIFHSAGNSGIAGQDLSSGGSADTILSGEGYGSLGLSVTLGDVNGDGYADAIVGAYKYYNGRGRVYIFHSAGSSGIAGQNLSSGGLANATLTGETTGSDFGYSVTPGDVNGDGYADVIVGAYGDYNFVQGRAYIFHSAGSSGIATTDAGLADTILTGEAYGLFGSSVTLGDINGDGYADAIVGAYGYNSKQGRAYIFHSAGSSGIADRDLSSGVSADAILTGEASGRDFGVSVALGDVNGDGYADAIVGAFCWFDPFPGRAYIFHSTGSMGISGQDLSSGGSADTILTGEAASRFGFSVGY